MTEQIIPKVGSVWQHTNGNYYTVLCVANEDLYTINPEEYPIMISYTPAYGEGRSIYGRTLARWKSMTLVTNFLNLK
jgi:hypothetical protein